MSSPRQRSHRGAFFNDLPHGPWEFFHPGGEPWMSGAMSEGGDSGPWTYFDDRGEVIATADFDERLGFDAARTGFDFGSFRDVEIEEEAAPWWPHDGPVPCSFAWALWDWASFVDRLEAAVEIDRRSYADGLIDRDDIQAVVDLHPSLQEVVEPLDRRYRELTRSAESLSPDRGTWWWKRAFGGLRAT